MDLILQGYLGAFSEEYELNLLPEDRRFEHFINYCVCSGVYGGSVSEPTRFHAGECPGIDGVIVIANDTLVFEPEQIQDLARVRLDVHFVFVQSKRSREFDQGEILKFGHAVKSFFGDRPSAVHKELEQFANLKAEVYRHVAKMERPPRCTLVYASTGNWVNEPILVQTTKQIVEELKANGYVDDISFVPLDLARIKDRWKTLSQRITKTITLEGFAPLPRITGVEQAYLGVVSCEQYVKLISTDDGELIRSIFYDNVRDFQGSNPVNIEISETLEGSEVERDKFVLLNNGITIVAKSIRPIGKDFSLDSFQVVNGCQTSHILWLNRDRLKGNEYVSVKLIATESREVTSHIIKATNWQTQITGEAFESLKPFHKELEDFFNNADAGPSRIYYERRSKQYDGITEVRKTRIVTLAILVNAFVAVCLEEPHSTVRYYGEVLNAYSGKIFDSSHEPYAYFVSAKLYTLLERLFGSGRLSVRYKAYRYHLMLMLWRHWQIKNSKKADHLRSKRNYEVFAQFHAYLSDEAKVSDTIGLLLPHIEAVAAAASVSYVDCARLRTTTQELLKRIAAAPAPMPTAKSEARHALRQTGKVKRFGSQMFGFIAGDDGREYYVNIADVKTANTYWLNEGAKVSFAAVKTLRGYVARHVEIE